MKNYTTDELVTISNNMQTYGGGFVKGLGRLMQRADAENKQKLIAIFPEYIEQYLNIKN